MAKRSSPNVPAPHRLRFTVSPGRVGFEIYSKIQRKSSTSTSKTNTQTAPQMGLQGREATLHGQAQEKPVHSSAPLLLHIYLPLQHRPSGSFTDAAPINTQAVSPDALKPSQVSPRPFSFIRQLQPGKANGQVSVSSFFASPPRLIQVKSLGSA